MTPPTAPLRVVGVGASAGGLDALTRLVASLPSDAGLAVVVLQHLPPDQHPLLAELLRAATSLPVIEVGERAEIVPNTILVVPARTCAEMSNGTSLIARVLDSGERPRLPIDWLFRSFAQVLGERAIGVVLSGTASDGTEGLRAIRDAGGVTIAQEPSTAQFDEMPRSAIAAGVVELVLAPDEIGAELGVLARSAFHREPRDGQAGIEVVLDQLREASGIDFTSYKRSTIERRLARRLGQLHLGSLTEYSEYLTTHPEESATVYEDLLIHVTEFFRDSPVLDRAISWLADPPRVKRAQDPVRIWVPGCSTGEEVYSIAMLAIERLGPSRPIQLFGTDLSERAIETARIGRYPDAIVARIGAERLARFFHRDELGYQIRREVRERCVFARHDLVTDPPFSKLDLVSCRNLLIYLGPKLQERVIPLFHYALEQPGILLLGSAETIGGFEELFDVVDAEARLYVRKIAPRTSLTFPQAGQLGRQPWRRGPDRRSTPDVVRDVDHLLLARYGPPCVLVDDNLDVVQFRGRTGTFLEPPPGQPQHNLLRMAREGLSPALRLAIDQARTTNTTARQPGLRIGEPGAERTVDLEVVPIRTSAEAGRHFLVIFEEHTAEGPPEKLAIAPADRGEVARLRDELAATRDFLETRAAQHLATSEQLGLANEELQSTNEELQSTNEELQTAKEELQSTNEELETLNDELQHGNADLRELNDDLTNVLASVEIAMIIVDTARRIRRFTPKARAVINLIGGDVGRPIADLKPSVDVPGLDAQIADVIETLVLHESEVAHADGTVYRMQIRPYRSLDHRIGGAVIAFVDITGLRAARDHARAIVEAVPTPLVVLDERLRILSANHAFRTAFELAEPTGTALLELGEWGADLRTHLEAVLFRGAVLDELALEFRGRDGRPRALQASARAMPSIDKAARIVLGISDVTERRNLEVLRQAAALERASFLDAISHELRSPLGVILLWAHAIRELPHADPRRLQGIDTIIEAARAQSQNVDDLLDLSLARTTQLSVSLAALDPAPIVRSAVDAAMPSANAKQLAVELRAEAGLVVMADARRLEQVVSKLLSNAIKFTPPGGRVSITLERAGAAISLAIHDSGPGIPPNIHTRMFEPFSRADTSITRSHPGLGIGLSLVSNLVERHHGTIEIATDGGTRITVRLPLQPGE